MEWVSVKTRLPHYGQIVFVWSSSSFKSIICVPYGEGKEIVWENPYGDDEINITHWKGIDWPEPPKE